MDYTHIYLLICDVLSGNRRAPDRATITASLHRPVFDQKALVTVAARRNAMELNEHMAHVVVHEEDVSRAHYYRLGKCKCVFRVPDSEDDAQTLPVCTCGLEGNEAGGDNFGKCLKSVSRNSWRRQVPPCSD